MKSTRSRNSSKEAGKLLLIAEVTRIFMSSMNTLSREFGIVFTEGYLYNLDENYGNYRDIIVTSFADGPVMKGLKKLVFYTATCIKGKASSLANTTQTTIYSESERSANYTVIAINKNVLAVGDFTFITEPFCYVEDNYKLITNIVKFLTQ